MAEEDSKEGFFWRKVSDREKEQIKKDAKAIMDSFYRKLSKVQGKVKDSYIEFPEFEREEGQGKEGDEIFKQRMLENAPNKNKDFIVAEKKKW